MKRLIAALALALAAFAAAPQAASQEPSVAAQQALLSDFGAWTLEYNAILNDAVATVDAIDEFVAVMDGFSAGEINRRAALARIDERQQASRERVSAARQAAAQLRRPPAFSALGAGGEALALATAAARDGLDPLLVQLGRMIDASAELGRSAIRDPSKNLEARERAAYESAVQLVRIDLVRLNLTLAALPPDNPNAPLVHAMRRYSEAVIIIPAAQLDALEGRPTERAAMATALREAARDIRANAARCEQLAAQVREQARWGGPREYEPLARIMVQMLDTYPPTIVAYRGLADAVDAAADSLSAGDDPLDAWDQLDRLSRPHFDEISRLENARARLATGQRSGL